MYSETQVNYKSIQKHLDLFKKPGLHSESYFRCGSSNAWHKKHTQMVAMGLHQTLHIIILTPWIIQSSVVAHMKAILYLSLAHPQTQTHTYTQTHNSSSYNLISPLSLLVFFKSSLCISLICFIGSLLSSPPSSPPPPHLPSSLF